jgi:hypothetical protein
MSTTPEKTLSKDGKEKKATAPMVSARPEAPGRGFGKARLIMQADGTWKAEIGCVNGDPRRSIIATLPVGITYLGGGRIPNPSDAAVYLPDGLNVDPTYIFPWTSDDPDPLRLGGGVVNGEIIEGAQRMNPKPKDPIQAPFLVSESVNGSPFQTRVYIPSELGVTFYPNEEAFALLIVDSAAATTTVIAVAKKEGTCLDLPPA